MQTNAPKQVLQLNFHLVKPRQASVTIQSNQSPAPAAGVSASFVHWSKVPNRLASYAARYADRMRSYGNTCSIEDRGTSSFKDLTRYCFVGYLKLI